MSVWCNLAEKISENPVAMIAVYAAAVSTASFLLALTLAVQSFRKSKRDGGLLIVDRADTGVVTQNGWNYHTFTMSVINVGVPTVSIKKYDLIVYEGLLNWIFRKTSATYKGDGWRVLRGSSSFSLALPGEASPPFALKSGEPIRLEIHTQRIWQDKRFRKVVGRIWHSHSVKPVTAVFRPLAPWSFLNDAELADENRKLLSGKSEINYAVHVCTENGWETEKPQGPE